MKEDYLWDKTGNDPAIERLEETLREFRFDGGTRQLPAHEIRPVEKPGLFRLFSLGFAAAAACIVIALISWTVWNRYSSDETVSIPDRGQATTSAPVVSTPVEPAPANPGVAAVAGVRPARELEKARKKRAVRVIAARTNRRKPAAEKLTQEEIYAYNRLVLALTIAGDKLNLVREKIKGE